MDIINDAPSPRYPLNMFASIQERKPHKQLDLSRAECLAWLIKEREVDDKEAAGLFSFAEYIDPNLGSRKVADIKVVHAVVGDIDDRFQQDKFSHGIQHLKQHGFYAAAYQTFNSTPDAQRWRVVVLLDEPVTPQRYYACWQGLDAIFGGILDKAAKDPSRLSYRASRPVGSAPRRGICIGAEV